MPATLVLDLETIPAMEIPPGILAEDRPAALCPPLAQVVAVGLLALKGGGEPEDREHALFDSWALPGKLDTPGEGALGERALLRWVGAVLDRADRVVTFNGRAFDIPTLLHRTLVHRLVPSATLVAAAREHRYYPDRHVDVLDLLTGHGAGARYSLTVYALAYGLLTPAEAARRDSGGNVEALVRAGETTRVVRHALEDVRLTSALYRRWAPVLERERAGA